MIDKLYKIKNMILIKIKHTKKGCLVDRSIVISIFLCTAIMLILNPVDNLHGKNNMSHTESNGINLTFTGDVMLSRYVTNTYKNKGASYYFSSISDLINYSDMTVVNIESAVVDDVEGEYTRTKNAVANFGINFNDLKEIEKEGVSLFSFSNNHIGDYGYKGIQKTIELLEDNSIKSVGLYKNKLEKLYYQENIKGINIAIISAMDAIPSKHYRPYLRDNIPGIISSKKQEDILMDTLKKAKKENDFIIVYNHWGEEYVSDVSKRQEELSEKLIDNGADLIIGHHPHIIQPVTVYKDKFIINSLGNFVFDQVQGDTSLLSTVTVNIDESGDLNYLKFRPMKLSSTRAVTLNKGPSKFRIKKRLFSKINHLYRITEDENGDLIIMIGDNK